jgi:hypothetical protein
MRINLLTHFFDGHLRNADNLSANHPIIRNLRQSHYENAVSMQLSDIYSEIRLEKYRFLLT